MNSFFYALIAKNSDSSFVRNLRLLFDATAVYLIFKISINANPERKKIPQSEER